MPEAAEPTFKIQISSPIEELSLTKMYDPLSPDAEGSFAIVKEVDITVATLSVTSANDADIYLGSSEPYDVAPLCTFDVLSPSKNTKISKLDIAIVADEIEVVNGEGEEEDKSKELEESGVLVEEKQEDNVEETPEVTEEKEESGGDEEDDDDAAKAESSVGDSDYETAPSEDGLEGEQGTSAEEEKADDKKEEPESTNDDVAEEKVDTAEDSKDEAVETTEESSSEPATAQSDANDETEKEEEQSTPTTTEEKKETVEPSTSASPIVPTCVVTLQVEYTPSKKEERDALYKELNNASKQKYIAVEKLRRTAAALSQVRASDTTASSSAVTNSSKNPKPAVKPGFLQKTPPKKKEPNFIMKLYNRTIGPDSMFRKVFPIAKNYCLFFGAIALFHFKGHELALPAPV